MNPKEHPQQDSDSALALSVVFVLCGAIALSVFAIWMFLQIT